MDKYTPHGEDEYYTENHVTFKSVGGLFMALSNILAEKCRQYLQYLFILHSNVILAEDFLRAFSYLSINYLCAVNGTKEWNNQPCLLEIMFIKFYIVFPITAWVKF